MFNECACNIVFKGTSRAVFLFPNETFPIYIYNVYCDIFNCQTNIHPHLAIYRSHVLVIYNKTQMHLSMEIKNIFL